MWPEQETHLGSPKLLPQAGQTTANNNTEAPVQSGDDFIKNFSAPAKQAVDTAPLTEPDPGNDSPIDTNTDTGTTGAGKSFFGFPPPPKPEERKPIFSGEDNEEGSEEPAAKPPRRPETGSERERKVRSIMRARDFLQSRLLAFVIARGDDPEEFAYDEEMLDELAKAWAHFFEENNIQVPANIDLIVTELYTTGALVTKAFKHRKLNKSIAEVVNNPAARALVKDMAKTDAVRSRFNIDSEGYYTYDKHGAYLQKEDRNEKADLKDLDNLVKLKANRGILTKIFDAKDLEAAGYNENENE